MREVEEATPVVKPYRTFEVAALLVVQVIVTLVPVTFALIEEITGGDLALVIVIESLEVAPPASVAIAEIV